MSAEILALLDPATPDTWPQGILAAADEAERMVADFAEPTTSEAADATYDPSVWLLRGHVRTLSAGTLAAVRRWRVIAEQHVPFETVIGVIVCAESRPVNLAAQDDAARRPWPCDDLTATADEARAYLGGAT